MAWQARAVFDGDGGEIEFDVASKHQTSLNASKCVKLWELKLVETRDKFEVLVLFVALG